MTLHQANDVYGSRLLGRGGAALLGLLATTLPVAAAVPRTSPAHVPPPLNAIVLLAAPGQVMPDGWPNDTHAVDAARVPDLAAADVQQALHGLLGKPITAALLGKIRTTIQHRLTAIHRPFAAIAIPRQQVHDGVLQVLVIEARLGTVKVEGAEYFSPQQYRDAVPLAPGQPIDSRALSAATDAINANQYRQAAIVASPGEAVGTTDLTIRAKDRLPLSLNLGFNNDGNNSTGLYQITTDIDWGNAFWRGDDLNYQFTATPDFYRLREHSLSYTTTLPWGDTLSVTGGYATSNTAPQGPIGSQGRNIDVSARYTITLPPVGRFIEHAGFGYDFKSTNNDVLFGGTNVFPSTSEIDQFVAGIDAGEPDRFGTSRIGLLVFGSPGGLSALNTDAAFAAQQPGARAEYAYARLTLDRVTVLPFHMAWHAAVTAQLSTGNLLPSEQLTFGGVQSIRGFVEQGTTRDEGVVWQNELRAPQLATGLGQLLHLGIRSDTLTPFLFLDVGAGGDHTQITGTQASWVELISTGLGVTWQFVPTASLRFTWGIPLVRAGEVGPLLGPQFAVQATF